VVEWFLLPELSCLAQHPIDLNCCEVQPGITLVFQTICRLKSGEKVDMIGYHHEVAHSIPLTIKVQQRVGNNLCQLRLSQSTLAVAGVEELFSTSTKLLLKFRTLLV